MCDSDIFISIPCIAVLRGLINDEENGICKRFLPEMFKEGYEHQKKYMELKSEYLKLKTKICGSTEFIIRTGGSSSSQGARQRSQSRDATASIPIGSKATVASSLVNHQQQIFPPTPGQSQTKKFTQTVPLESFHTDLEKLILGQSTVSDILTVLGTGGLMQKLNTSNQPLEEMYQKVHNLVRHLGMELQRHSPTEWNEFMNAACMGCNQ